MDWRTNEINASNHISLSPLNTQCSLKRKQRNCQQNLWQIKLWLVKVKEKYFKLWINKCYLTKFFFTHTSFQSTMPSTPNGFTWWLTTFKYNLFIGFSDTHESDMQRHNIIPSSWISQLFSLLNEIYSISIVYERFMKTHSCKKKLVCSRTLIDYLIQVNHNCPLCAFAIFNYYLLHLHCQCHEIRVSCFDSFTESDKNEWIRFS